MSNRVSIYLFEEPNPIVDKRLEGFLRILSAKPFGGYDYMIIRGVEGVSTKEVP